MLDSFRSQKTLRRLNIAAVGLAMSACTAAVMMQSHGFPGIITGPPTLLLGALWAWTLGSKRTVGRSQLRIGWVLSVPFAMMNAGLAAGLMIGSEGKLSGFFMGIALGATLGIIVWGPALAITLALFGVPIAWGQKLAKKGLAGEERGETLVASICALLSLAGAVLAFGTSDSYANNAFELGRAYAALAGLLGALVGVVALVVGVQRARDRNQFVRNVEQGTVPGFRVDTTAEGKALVRVVSFGQGYRVADFSEELLLLTADNEAAHALGEHRAPRVVPEVGRVTTRCAKCTRDNPDNYKFCLGCGAALSRDAATQDSTSD